MAEDALLVALGEAPMTRLLVPAAAEAYFLSFGMSPEYTAARLEALGVAWRTSRDVLIQYEGHEFFHLAQRAWHDLVGRVANVPELTPDLVRQDAGVACVLFFLCALTMHFPPQIEQYLFPVDFELFAAVGETTRMRESKMRDAFVDVGGRSDSVIGVLIRVAFFHRGTAGLEVLELAEALGVSAAVDDDAAYVAARHSGSLELVQRLATTNEAAAGAMDALATRLRSAEAQRRDLTHAFMRGWFARRGVPMSPVPLRGATQAQAHRWDFARLNHWQIAALQYAAMQGTNARSGSALARFHERDGDRAVRARIWEMLFNRRM